MRCYIAPGDSASNLGGLVKDLLSKKRKENTTLRIRVSSKYALSLSCRWLSCRVTQSCVMNIYREKGWRWPHVQTDRETGTKTEAAQRQRNRGGTQRLVNMEVVEGPFFTDRERETERETERDGERQRQTETDRERDRDEGRVPQTDLEVGAKALAVVRPPVLPGVAGLLAPRRDGSSEVGVTRRYVLTHQQPRIACASKQAHNGAQRCCLLQCRRKAA